MQMLTGYNGKLAWVLAGALAWSALSLALVLGGTADAPPIGLHVGLPPGAIEVPGHLLKLVETEDALAITVGLPPREYTRYSGRLEQMALQLPENLDIQLEEVEGGQPPEPELSLLDDGNRPVELPGQRHMLVTSHFIVTATPRHVLLLPTTEENIARASMLLERRPGWQPPEGGRGRQSGNHPRRGLFERLQQEFKPGEGKGGDRPPPGGNPPRQQPPPGR